MSKQGFGGILRSFFEFRAIAPFLVGATALAMAGNGCYDLARHLLERADVPPLMNPLVIIVSAVLIVLLMVVFLWLWAKKQRRAVAITGSEPAAKRKGLIVLVSNVAVSQKAADWHMPGLRHCWLVHSGATAKQASEVAATLASKPGLKVHLVDVVDGFNAMEVAACVNAIHADLAALGLAAKDVILDFTGMTAPASVGAAVAALALGMPLQYTPTDYDENLKPTGPADPVELHYDWQALAQGGGGGTVTPPDAPEVSAPAGPAAPSGV